MTKAEIQFEEVRKIPSIKALIDRLDLILLPDKNSASVSARVQTLIDSFASRNSVTATPRYVFTESSESFFDPQRVEQHLLAFYGPRPWTYPLTKTPF